MIEDTEQYRSASLLEREEGREGEKKEERKEGRKKEEAKEDGKMRQIRNLIVELIRNRESWR